MTKQASPFFDFDVTKLMAEYKMPGLDMDAVVAAHRKNIEALTKANQTAVEGFQHAAKRQGEIIRQSLEEASAMAREMVGQGSPEEKMAKQADMVKSAVEKGLANATELAELMNKSNREAADIVSKRLLESLDELKTMVDTKK